MAENYFNPGFMGGAMYNPQPVRPKMTNPLTAEEREALKTDNSFNLSVTPEEAARAVCTHKDPVKGEFAIVRNADGSCTCNICHATFNPDIVDDDSVVKATDTMVNVLETCKLLGLDVNPEIVRGFYQMIPFLKKTPQLYKLSYNAFNRYNNAQPVQQVGGNASYFGALNMLTNPTVPMGQPQYGYGYGYQQPMGQPIAQPFQQPVMTPFTNMQAQTVPGGNPFYAPQQPMGQPMAQPAQQPAAQPVQVNPPAYQPAQTAAPQQEAVVKETVQL